MYPGGTGVAGIPGWYSPTLPSLGYTALPAVLPRTLDHAGLLATVYRKDTLGSDASYSLGKVVPRVRSA